MRGAVVKIRKPIEDWIIWKATLRIERGVLALASISAVVCVCASVFMRYILKMDFFGLEEVITLLAMWIYWIGGVYGSYENSHITADISNIFIKTDSAKFRLNVVTGLLTVLISGVFAYWSVAYYAIWNIKAGTKTIGLHIPYLASNMAITVGFIMMFLYSLYHLIRLFLPRIMDDVSDPGSEVEQ
jgi:TRAP-type C4-dicarboxylate transport system permease small subunit